MYNHRIVPDGTKTFSDPITDFVTLKAIYHKAYWESDTIPITSEWTAEQLKVLAEITI